jgi:hypothetical protein
MSNNQNNKVMAGIPLKSVGILPKSLGIQPKSLGATPKFMGATPESMGIPTKSMGTMPKSMGATPKSMGISPISMGATPESMGIPPKSFYSSSSNRTKSEFSRKLSIKRKLNSACEIVKSKRTQDYILSDKLYKTEPGKGGFLFSDSDPPAIYQVFAKQSEALEFADRSEKPILFYWTWRIYF